MLDKPLVTHQTGPEGRIVRRVYIEEASQVARELYLGLVVDRKAAAVGIIASTEGGTDIEEVAAKTPEKIITDPVDPLLGMAPFQARRIAFALGLKDKQVGQFAMLIGALYRAFVETDASLIEINPLVVTTDGARALSRRQDRHSTTTVCSAIRTSVNCATRTKRTRPRPRPRSTT